ncbi:hypothetical protein M9458_013962, partial [Cirrhinus mrigala]
LPARICFPPEWGNCTRSPVPSITATLLTTIHRDLLTAQLPAITRHSPGSPCVLPNPDQEVTAINSTGLSG